MDADLQDVGLEALDAMEAQDAAETDNNNEGTSETTDVEDAGVNTNDSNTEVDETEGNDTESDDETQEETKSDEEEVNDKKELSDEEFEEMAKKKGYAKTPNEEEKAKEEEHNARMEQLMACPEEIDESVWNQLPPQNRLIYNTLPYITAEGKDGDITVKTPDQLPEDFEFKNKKAEMKFQNDLQAQEMKAEKMSEALNARAEQYARETANRREAVKVISEIEKLQKDGDLPTPKAKQGTKEFDTDPAVELINKVLNYRSQRMSEGVNLTIKDSLMLYKSQHPEDFEQKEAKGDIERKNIAKKIAGGSKASGTPANSKAKPQYYRPGMSTEDVIDRIMDDWDN